ncbi:MAG TPA: peptidoglycan bridge formation glycyltransferase FemA/FemB family protein, partial [Chloroflexota bacterium]|nr:peptidoglycan bridge formation glycyltransferase FemA/FemB family protein [Chloroflexota bacterium]
MAPRRRGHCFKALPAGHGHQTPLIVSSGPEPKARSRQVPLTLQEWSDQRSWDAFVGSQETCHFHQGWGWGDLAEPLGVQVRRLAVMSGTDMVAAASVGIIPIRQGKLSQLFISRGPVVDDPTAEIFELLDNGLRRLGRENNAIGCRIEPGASMGDRRWPHALRAIGCRPLYPPSQARSTWVLDLAPDEDRLLEAMKPKWRYNIRLAQKRGVEVRTGGADDVDVFYRLYRETATRDGFFIHGPSLYREV